MAGRPQKFAALQKFLDERGKELRNRGERSLRLTFNDIEGLGVELPVSAYKHRAWWANSYYNDLGFINQGANKKPWERAKFCTEKVDMEGRMVTFRYVEGRSPGEAASKTTELQKGRSVQLPSRAGMAETPRTYSAEKREEQAAPGRCRHPIYGALKGHIRLVAGTDLTQPADPEWGERVWGKDKKK